MPVDKPKSPSSTRGLSKEKIVLAAVELMESLGETGFSLRKLGQQMGCDPMTVLYHFTSKEGLNRAMADWLTAQLVEIDADQPWDRRLHDLAHQYRGLALKYPNTFGLMQRFLHTGMADFRLIETTHRAFRDAHIAEQDIPKMSLAWHATVYGLAMAEIDGLIRQATAEDLIEVEQLSDRDFPLTKQLMPLYVALDTDATFELAVNVWHEGIRQQRRH
ncbi:MAG: TetR/AcrR family transcriptional regulator [Burkholderiaceae bacterium]|nr:TetR/AcrR family transcriptional regulator [Burkholderiaceae bacterium]